MAVGKKFISIICFMLFTAGACFGLNTSNPNICLQPPDTRRIVLKLKPGIKISPEKQNGQIISLGVSSLDRLNESFGIRKQEMLFSRVQETDIHSDLANLIVIEAPDGVDMDSLVSEYGRLNVIEYVHRDVMMNLHEIPNDSLFDFQWSLENNGQPHYHVVNNSGSFNDALTMLSGEAGADINARPVYSNPPENTKTVIIAIIDTGVDINHPELSGHIWLNPNEFPENGLDDDHNGFIDDLYGWDFTGESTIGGATPDNDPTDNFGHGTHCAGIIAAVTNNAVGIAGITADCRIMPVKVFPLMLSSYIAQAIVYAADNGTDVINMSFGYHWHVQVIEDALAYAHSRGVVLCASAGNDGDEYLNYPASSALTMAISASTSSNKLAGFSTYGPHINVCAPGESILSLRAEGTDIYAEYDEPNVHIIKNSYYLASGTSMSAPHVAGVAAYVRKISPGLIPAEVVSIIENSASDVLYPLDSGAQMPGWDKYTGHGCINLAAAVQSTPERCAILESPANHELISGTVDIHGICDAEDITEYVLEYGHGSQPQNWIEFASGYTASGSRILGVFNTADFNGLYSIRARVGENNISQVAVDITNSCKHEITWPNANDTVHSQISILGSAICADFLYYKLEYAAADNPEEWTMIASSSRIVEDSILAKWQTSLVESGDYLLKLSLYSEQGQISSETLPFTIISPFSGPNGWHVEIPARISSVVNYADLDNDGNEEILVGSSQGLYIFNSDGSFYSDNMPLLESCNCRSAVAVGKLDYDQIEDLATIVNCPLNDSVYAYLYMYSSESGQFLFPLNQSIKLYFYDNADPNVYPYCALKDFDQDSIDEIFIHIEKACSIYDWDLTTKNIYKIGDTREIYIAADLNADGYDELYAVSGNILYEIHPPNTIVNEFKLIDSNSTSIFECRSLSAIDFDYDNKHELVVSGFFQGNLENHWIFTFDDNLQIKPGWPHNTGINSYLVPSHPVFSDLDHDLEMEYYVSTFELSQGQIFAWNIDGTPLGTMGASPIWARTENPGILSPPLVADIDGDSYPDLIVEAKRDMYHTYKVERIVAWNSEGQPIDGWPVVTSNELDEYLNYCVHIPTLGDINNDGFIDMAVTSAANELLFLNLFGVPFTDSSATVPLWKYNRKLNSVSDYNLQIIVNAEDVETETGTGIPERFELFQNCPNPFNPLTKISFSLPANSEVTFKVFNILGQTIEEINLGFLETGFHTLSWDAETLSSGVYFYQIKTRHATKSRKMLLLK